MVPEKVPLGVSERGTSPQTGTHYVAMSRRAPPLTRWGSLSLISGKGQRPVTDSKRGHLLTKFKNTVRTPTYRRLTSPLPTARTRGTT